MQGVILCKMIACFRTNIRFKGNKLPARGEMKSMNEPENLCL
ncbi:hypothetical protein CLV93_101456 [Prolixibacter denitrificans]|uniref:Uncharacterized protein n=1 Tax=Prolixibacter denitrificans TaxID=1541063 RepID=A0A2P8CKJ5_9BACT|nr:hypothetical protein CLV93_101456 [Prolixibacter denitrificans]